MSSSRFPDTRWSLILPRDSPPGAVARAAAELCGLYWRPVYSYILGSSLPPRSREDAEDLTQGFFLSLLQRGSFQNADPAKGRLRSYLLSAVKHYLLNEHRDMQAEKRGGGVRLVSLDAPGEHGRALAVLAAGSLSPDQAFERRWAECLLENSLRRLHQRCVAEGRESHYAALRPLLAADGHDRPRLQNEAAARLGLSAGTLRVAFHRFHRHYRAILEEEIKSTLLPGMDAGEEMRHLVQLLQSPAA